MILGTSGEVFVFCLDILCCVGLNALHRYIFTLTFIVLHILYYSNKDTLSKSNQANGTHIPRECDGNQPVTEGKGACGYNAAVQKFVVMYLHPS